MDVVQLNDGSSNKKTLGYRYLFLFGCGLDVIFIYFARFTAKKERWSRFYVFVSLIHFGEIV